MGHFNKWRSDLRLQFSDAGVGEYERCCRALQTMACFDQLDMPNLGSAELLARSIQLIAEKYKDKAHSATDPVSGEEGHLFMGSQHAAANVCVCPSLSVWIAEELRKESVVAKEKRKAREERALVRPKAKQQAQG